MIVLFSLRLLLSESVSLIQFLFFFSYPESKVGNDSNHFILYLIPRVENTGNIFLKLLTYYSMSKEMSNEVLFPREKKNVGSRQIRIHRL